MRIYVFVKFFSVIGGGFRILFGESLVRVVKGSGRVCGLEGGKCLMVVIGLGWEEVGRCGRGV